MDLRLPALSLVLVIAVAGLSPVSVEAAPRSYPVICRGGGGMKLFIRGVNTGHAPGVVLHFRGARRGASRQPPGPGECAWLDRGFRPGELSSKGTGEVYILGLDAGFHGLHGIMVSSGGFQLQYRQDASGRSTMNLVEAGRRGGTFQLYMYRFQGPKYRATHLGP